MNKTTKKLSFDLSRRDGHFKILNATNGGPWHKRHANDQLRGNFKAYQAARIPYSRNHDSAINSRYAHDITLIFPDFNADVNDPASYDFACTDESILCTLDAPAPKLFSALVSPLNIRSKSTEHFLLKIFTSGLKFANTLSATTMRVGLTALI